MLLLLKYFLKKLILIIKRIFNCFIYYLNRLRRCFHFNLQDEKVVLIKYNDKNKKLKNFSIFIILIFIMMMIIFLLTIIIYYQIINYLKFRLKEKFDKNGENNNNGDGINVIVGQYMGKGYPWINHHPLNLTDEILNMNNYSPIKNYGENGSPVYLSKTLNYNKEYEKLLFSINQFNLIVSDMISINRSLPDVRKKKCKKQLYRLDQLSNTSIIIVFHNEAWSTLLRTIQSIIIRTPKQLIQEIILVDDDSQRLFLKKNLDNYIEKLSKENQISIKIIRSTKRIGLIRSRILGANHSIGQVLTFLDSHCECTTGWLEPLLYRLSLNANLAICPVIDIINDKNFAYIRSFDKHIGAINWSLNFRWYSSTIQSTLNQSTKSSIIESFPTPIMAGGLFAINRKYFFKLGTYDSNLKIWGGENIELSLRIWQCGGRIEISPCSHVGHIFRSSSPYTFNDDDDDNINDKPEQQVGNVLFSNLIRVIEVWLDDYKYLFYNLNPSALELLKKNQKIILKNIDQRIELRNRLKCKSFEWYLNNVWPENFFPINNKNLFGHVKNLFNNKCLQRSSSSMSIGPVLMKKCSLNIYGLQSFILPLPNQIGHIKSDENVCLDVVIRSNQNQDLNLNNNTTKIMKILLTNCNYRSTKQKWKFNFKTKQIIHVKTSLCLTLDELNLNNMLILKKCFINNNNNGDRRQSWKLILQNWKQH